MQSMHIKTQIHCRHPSQDNKSCTPHPFSIIIQHEKTTSAGIMEALQRRTPPWLSPWCSPKFSSWSWFLKGLWCKLCIPQEYEGFLWDICNKFPPPPQKKEGLNKNRLSSWHHPFSDASASSFHGGYFLSTQDDRIHTCDRSILGFHVQVNLIVYPPEN